MIPPSSSCNNSPPFQFRGTFLVESVSMNHIHILKKKTRKQRAWILILPEFPYKAQWCILQQSKISWVDVEMMAAVMMNRHKSQSQGYSWTNPRKCIILLDSQASFNKLFCFYSLQLQLIYTFLLAEKTCCLLKICQSTLQYLPNNRQTRVKTSRRPWSGVSCG